MPSGQPHNEPKFHNRICGVMEHCSRYSFKGKARLARDVGVSRATVTRLTTGQCWPSCRLLLSVTAALEHALKRRIDPRDLISADGTYPTPSVCAVVGCSGCLPSAAYDEAGRRTPEYRHVQPGQWSGDCVEAKNQGEAL
jgi:hypothetical protein